MKTPFTTRPIVIIVFSYFGFFPCYGHADTDDSWQRSYNLTATDKSLRLTPGMSADETNHKLNIIDAELIQPDVKGTCIHITNREDSSSSSELSLSLKGLKGATCESIEVRVVLPPLAARKPEKLTVVVNGKSFEAKLDKQRIIIKIDSAMLVDNKCILATSGGAGSYCGIQSVTVNYSIRKPIYSFKSAAGSEIKVIMDSPSNDQPLSVSNPSVPLKWRVLGEYSEREYLLFCYRRSAVTVSGTEPKIDSMSEKDGIRIPGLLEIRGDANKLAKGCGQYMWRNVSDDSVKIDIYPVLMTEEALNAAKDDAVSIINAEIQLQINAIVDATTKARVNANSGFKNNNQTLVLLSEPYVAITEKIAANLGRLRQLTRLELNSLVPGQRYAHVSSIAIPNVKEVVLRNINRVEGVAIWAALSNMNWMQSLECYDCELPNTLLQIASLGNNESLQSIWIENNKQFCLTDKSGKITSNVMMTNDCVASLITPPKLRTLAIIGQVNLEPLGYNVLLDKSNIQKLIVGNTCGDDFLEKAVDMPNMKYFGIYYNEYTATRYPDKQDYLKTLVSQEGYGRMLERVKGKKPNPQINPGAKYNVGLYFHEKIPDYVHVENTIRTNVDASFIVSVDDESPANVKVIAVKKAKDDADKLVSQPSRYAFINKADVKKYFDSYNSK